MEEVSCVESHMSNRLVGLQTGLTIGFFGKYHMLSCAKIS